jgi:hypothetical protein
MGSMRAGSPATHRDESGEPVHMRGSSVDTLSMQTRYRQLENA